MARRIRTPNSLIDETSVKALNSKPVRVAPHPQGTAMVRESHLNGFSTLDNEYQEALSLCGLVDDVVQPELLDPRPYRYDEGEYICRLYHMITLKPKRSVAKP